MSGDGHDDSERALAEFSERTASLLIGAGLARMPARVLMALMASETGGLTSQELQERLGVSAAAVSGAVQYLQSTNFIRRVVQPGSRRERYELPDDYWYQVSTNAVSIYQPLAQLAEDALAALAEDESTRAARIREMAEYFRFMQRRMPELNEEWEASRRRMTDA
jgi:DNA-binding transcriptional regulator GbsR (MarR family)